MLKKIPSNRLDVVDALRGFALMALFLIHMIEYFELYWYQPEPGIVHDVLFFMFAGKAYAIFALLFGVSFFIQMENQAQKGIDFRGRFAWRLTLLLIFGYIHGLLYSGDILQVLAVAGFFLLLVYRQSNRVILLLALVLLLQFPLILQFIISLFATSSPDGQPWHWTLMPANFEIYAKGNFRDFIATNSFDGQFGKWVFFVETGRVYTVIGLFFLGLFIARQGYFAKIAQNKQWFFKGFIISLVFALLWQIILSFIPNLALTGMSHWLIDTLVNNYLNLSLMLTGIFLFCLLYQIEILSRMLKLLAPCGRMSLTLYVTQSLVGVPLYYGFGAAAFQYLGQVNSLLLGLVLWSMQILFAHYWLARFKYGPLEWCWRSMTYGKKVKNLVVN